MTETWVTFGKGKKAHLQVKRTGNSLYAICGIGGWNQNIADHDAEKCKNCIREIERESRWRLSHD